MRENGTKTAMKTPSSLLLCSIALAAIIVPTGNASVACTNDEVSQWERHEISMGNSTWDDNPFDLELRGVFTSPSGRELKQWGFYAGNNTWKIYFMPDEVGLWSYETTSSDSELSGKTGSFVCVESDVVGQLLPVGNRWRIADGGGDFPVIWNVVTPDEVRWGFRARGAESESVQEALKFADETVGARLLGFDALLTVPRGWAADWPQEVVPFVNGREGEEFNLPFWDRLNAKLDAARDRGMGAYIMFYSDDELTPDHFGLTPRSKREKRYFRYAVARLSAYPHVLWDTGIDIGEYRDQAWNNWFCRWMKNNDPWQHPVGSRSGGGSGGSLPAEATYFSTGGAGIPSRSDLLKFLKQDLPVAHTDHWRPFIDRGNWTHKKIRIAHWRCALSGAQSLYPDYNQGDTDYDQVRLGGRFIGCATAFFREELQSDLLDLVPHDELIRSGDGAILAANPGREYVVYDEDGGELDIDLSGFDGSYCARWYDPRTGEWGEEEMREPGDSQIFTSPTPHEDWVLHISR